MLDNITPVLLTYNEECNIARTLSHLAWAKDIVVVDCGSSDGTVAILGTFPNVRIFRRPFDTHANQWRYAVENTQIRTDWVLRLDADYEVSKTLVSELAELDSGAAVNGYRIRFEYAIFSHVLLSSLYPPNTVLLRRGYFSLWDKGHTEAWDVRGAVVTLRGRIIHNDWKPIGQWLMNQTSYMQRELDRFHTRKTGMVRWLRRWPPLMPIAVLLYCLFGKGLILNGRAGIFYALQRMVAEAVFSLMMLEESLRDHSTRSAHQDVVER
jgi:glycosyltransferase involved in cell wall biosynthesis